MQAEGASSFTREYLRQGSYQQPGEGAEAEGGGTLQPREFFMLSFICRMYLQYLTKEQNAF